uniref:Protein kinase domain-containing protein n=1 Tax=Alexandrium catenella TaxID=2925 RepID=A0A7S1WN08_ALECA|mmetsp:Transcript_75627/g.200895  ORF Transcript_75627/g.200895 Transcript_75627/m.200895 type:complete len:333 (+) Transcript_75627:42-1040(+)
MYSNSGLPPVEPRLPPIVSQRLAERGYEVESSDDPLDLGAEKYVFGAWVKQPSEGASERTGVVVLYSKRAGRSHWAWKYQRELEVFQDLKSAGLEHPNIIRMLDFLPPTKDHGPCMVLERIDPLGFDMFKVVKQYQGAKERTLPVAQWMHYLGQIIQAVERLHERGWVHADLKPDNIMVDQGHEIKVIDFGLSRRSEVEFNPGRTALYAPPEFSNTRGKVDKSADVWLIGAMMFVVFAQMQVCFRAPNGRLFEVTNHQHARKHGVAAAIRDWWGKTVDPTIGEALDNLLRRDPLERWTLQRLQEWWQATKGDLHREKLLPLPGNAQQCLFKH